MKAYVGVDVHIHIFLTSALVGGVSGQLHAPAALPRWKNPRYKLNKRLFWPETRSRRRGEKSYRDSNSEPAVVQLSRLLLDYWMKSKSTVILNQRPLNDTHHTKQKVWIYTSTPPYAFMA
jgi:hypothetical protein